METILNSLGIGDRFGMQGQAQLKAFQLAEDQGITVIPVWNKSHREHSLTGTVPADVRKEADEAVQKTGWKHAYHVDADHINLGNVSTFLEVSDFFTIDVADKIGVKPEPEEIEDFTERNKQYIGELRIEGLDKPIEISRSFLEEIAFKFLSAAKEAGNIFKKISESKGTRSFMAEVSMDEVEHPQSPAELFFILSELIHTGFCPDTIAPRFSGSFHKGVDYSGDIQKFGKEFEQDLLVIEHIRKEQGINKDIRLSVHSGSDKFSLYPVIRSLTRKHGKGIHLKTAGTTWLEEFTGLILSGEKGLEFAKKTYAEAIQRIDELTEPYRMVTDIRLTELPSPEIVNSWNISRFSQAVTHDETCSFYNPALRQLIHLAYKLAAENFSDYRELVLNAGNIIGKRVTNNIYARHIKPLFIG